MKTPNANLAVIELAALIRSGLSSRQALDGFKIQELSPSQQQQFKFIWQVALQSGGRIADALERLGQVFSQQQKQLSDLEVAYASPRATARLILWLPLASMFIGQLLGISAIEASLNSRLGVVALGLGLLMLIGAKFWSGRMLQKASPTSLDPAGYLDAVVIGLRAGLPPEKAKSLADKTINAEVGITASENEQEELASAISLSKKTGIPLGEIISAKADSLRQSHWHQKAEQVSRLSVSLMIPLGLAALPAFILLAVVPMALGLMR